MIKSGKMTNPTDKSGAKASAAGAVRGLMRQALKGALATLHPATGGPYASLVTVATGFDGRPLMLLSGLAVHTQNLKADPRVSLMIDGTSATGDPLAGGRVSLMGRIGVTTDAADRRRFLARHPDADMYASFADFAFYSLAITHAHFVGGFGRIVDLSAADVLVGIDDASGLLAAEDEIVAHMNADHADAVGLYAALAVGPSAAAAEWRMSGLDPEGLDLIASDGRTARVGFAQRVTGPGTARQALVALAAKARTEFGAAGH